MEDIKKIISERYNTFKLFLIKLSDNFVKMKMRNKLRLGYSMGLVIFVIVALVAIYSRVVFTDNLDQIASVAVKTKSYQKFALTTEKAVTALNHYVISGDNESKENFKKQLVIVNNTLDSVLDSYPNDIGLVDVLQDSINVIESKAEAIFDIPFQLRLKKSPLVMYEVNATASDIYDVLEIHAFADEEYMKDVFAHTEKTMTLVDLTMAVGGVFVMAVALIFVFYLDRSVRIPIEHLSKDVKGISSGKWERVTAEGSEEISHLADEFNSMVERVSASYEFLERKVEQRTAELNKLNKKLEQLAITDELTGLYNHRYFYEKLEEELLRGKRYKHQVSLLMIDVDHFKKFNDTHGHLAGDEVLEKVARSLEKCVRDTDTVARYGGEEFAVIIPEVDIKGVLATGERLRESVQSEKFPYKGTGPNGSVTISVGAAIYPTDADDVTELIRLADEALYSSKEHGRNRVEHFKAS